MADEYSNIPGLTADEIAAMGNDEKLEGEEQVIGDDNPTDNATDSTATAQETQETQTTEQADATAAAQTLADETATAQDATAGAQDTAGTAAGETVYSEPDLNQQLASAQHQLDQNLKTSIKQLAQQYEDGELSFVDFEEAKAELTAAHQRQTVQYQQAISAYQSEVNALNRTHPNWERTGNSPEFVAWLQKQPPGIQTMSKQVNAQNYAYLLDSYSAQSGQGKPAKSEKPQPAKVKADVPVTLAGIPSAAMNTESTEFAHLENLTGLDFEAALSKLTPEQQAKFLNS